MKRLNDVSERHCGRGCRKHKGSRVQSGLPLSNLCKESRVSEGEGDRRWSWKGGQSTGHVRPMGPLKCMHNLLSALRSHEDCLSKEGTCMIFWVVDTLQRTTWEQRHQVWCYCNWKMMMVPTKSPGISVNWSDLENTLQVLADRILRWKGTIKAI